MSQWLTKERTPSHADLSANRNRNVSDRHAVEMLCCCHFNLHKEGNGEQLINRDPGTVTNLSAVLRALTTPRLKPIDKSSYSFVY